MEERQLLLLGLLLSEDLHGYRINEYVENNLADFAQIKRSTSYSTLAQLCKSGHVKLEIEQVGNRPPRKMYTITETGRALFEELLRASLVKQEGFAMPIETALLYIDAMPEEERMHYLQQRLAWVEKSIRDLEATPSHSFAVGVDLAISHRVAMLKADRAWLQEHVKVDARV